MSGCGSANNQEGEWQRKREIEREKESDGSRREEWKDANIEGGLRGGGCLRWRTVMFGDGELGERLLRLQIT